MGVKSSMERWLLFTSGDAVPGRNMCPIVVGSLKGTVTMGSLCLT